MITKTGIEYAATLEKKASGLLGGMTGAVRASNLSDEERKKITSYYGLPQDASLGWRNAGRGYLGGALGSVVGASLPLPLKDRLWALLLSRLGRIFATFRYPCQGERSTPVS